VECYPSDIENRLGFDVVRRNIDVRLQTSVGRTALVTERPDSTRSQVSERLKLVSEWQEALAAGQAPGFSGLPDLSEAFRRIAPAGSWLEPLDLLDVVASLTVARQVEEYFSARSERFPAVSAVTSGLFSDHGLEKSLDRVVDDQGVVRDDASPELRRIRKQIRNQEGSIRNAAERALRAARDAGYDGGEAPTIRGGRMVIPVKTEGRRKLPGSIVDTSTTGKTAFLEPEECVELSNELRLLEAQERREIVRIMVSVTDTVRDVADAMLNNQQILGEQDVLRAKATLANEIEAIVPEIGDGSEIRLIAGANPALLLLRKESSVQGQKSRPVIPLTLHLTRPEATLVVSGPNAGGKSVAMKTVGLFALMLAHGMPVPCRDGSIVPLFGRLMVVLGDDQSLENDLSTFSSHLESLKSVVETADRNTLVLVDEIGTGTDPAAGEAIATAILEHLTSVGAFTIVTTHFGGLKAFAHSATGMVNGAMRFDPEKLEPDFVFEKGVPGSSYAIEIAERASFPHDLLERARGHFGAERTQIEELILELSRSKQELAERSGELETTLAAARDSERRHKEARQELDASRDAILRSANDKAESLLKEANRRIENTIREIKEAQAEKAKTREARQELDTFRKTVEQKASKTKPAKTSSDTGAQQRPLEVGDFVSMEGGTATGRIVRMQNGDAVVAFDVGELHVEHSKLRRAGPPKKSKNPVSISGSPILDIEPRLDLRGYRVADAILAVEKYLDDALRVGMARVEILHGTGTGALREAVRVHLRGLKQVRSVEEAPVDQGGAGVTYVFLS